jgi:hypothetical protein
MLDDRNLPVGFYTRSPPKYSSEILFLMYWPIAILEILILIVLTNHYTCNVLTNPCTCNIDFNCTNQSLQVQFSFWWHPGMFLTCASFRIHFHKTDFRKHVHVNSYLFNLALKCLLTKSVCQETVKRYFLDDKLN